MKITHRILAALSKGPGNTTAVHQKMADAHFKSVQIGLSSLRAQGLVEGQRMPGSPAKYWSITEAGLAELRRAGMGVEPPSTFGCFGERIGQVRTVFELGRVAA